MIYIGIDPAFRKNGFGCAIIDSAGEVAFPTFRTFLDFIIWATDKDTFREKAVVCVENSNLSSTMFYRPGRNTVMQSRDLGKNQAISQCTVDFCRWAFGDVIQVSPKEKGKKWTQAETVQVMKQEKHTSEKKRLSQDDRDAYKLALIGKKSYRITRRIP